MHCVCERGKKCVKWSYRSKGGLKTRVNVIVCRSIYLSRIKVSQRGWQCFYTLCDSNYCFLFQIRSQSKASGSGLCEGDEVVSINGNPCADLTYPQVIKLMESITDSLQMLIKRYKRVVGIYVFS